MSSVSCSSLPGQLCCSVLNVLPCCMSALMALRVWCPQSMSCFPLGSVMVVVAGSAGCASHTSMGVALSVCGGAVMYG